jgi:hypothetical protein
MKKKDEKDVAQARCLLFLEDKVIPKQPELA